MATLTDVLRPSVVTKIVSRIRVPGNVFSKFLGVEIGGDNIEKFDYPLPQYTYDIFDNVRKVAKFRARGVEAGTFAANPVGNNTVSLIRVAEKLPMDYNKISAIRTLGENAGSIDIAGKRYVEQQAKQAKRRQSNARELIASSFFYGGKLYCYQIGDDLVPSWLNPNSNAMFSVDFKMDAGNVLQGSSFAAGLQMGTGSNIVTAAWSNNATDIILQLQAISAAFESLVGEPLMQIWCNSTVWNNVIQNTLVRQFAGTANTPVFEWIMTDQTGSDPEGSDGKKVGVQRARLKGMEWVTWHIYDGGIEVYDGTGGTASINSPFTKVVPDNYVLFMIEPDKGSTGWIRGVEGQEIVKENDLAPAIPVSGFHSWIMEKADPARFDLHTLQNFTMEFNIPQAMALARVQ